MRVSIITRAFDRLEYTIQCINGVLYNAGYEDYEHIIVNQGSSDGTRQWLNWIKKMPNKWYEKVRPIHLKQNVGDFGGMKVGFDNADGDLIMQLDNDVYMETENWLYKMIYAFKKTNADTLMADRKGIRQQIPYDPHTLCSYMYNFNELRCAKIPNAVACYIVKRAIFGERYKSAKRCRHLTQGDNCWKLLDVFGVHIEGYNPEDGSYIQQDKFGFQTRKQFLSKRFIFKHGIRR
jgi:glycosyltransferase involved in cell wall biosynthesis